MPWLSPRRASGPRFSHSLGAVLDRAGNRLACVAGAVGTSQAPEFFQQYLQRLQGRLDEARLQFEGFRRAAVDSGLTVDGLATRAASSADPAIVHLGAVVHAASVRVEHLAAAVRALEDASAFSRPFAFLAHFDAATAAGAWQAFRPAVPTTAEGLVYALAGLAAAHVLYRMAVGGIARGWSRLRRKPPLAPPVGST